MSTQEPKHRDGAPNLRFADLHRGFGRLPVLRGVSGSVDGGQVLLVTGSNGSGKSTLLRCLAGLLRPERGTIHCRTQGRELDAGARRRAVGYVAPDLAFYPQLSTEENLTFFARLRGVDPATGRTLLARVGLPLDRLAGHLSSGMQQRLRWAAALLHQPAVLLLDEPLQNLDDAGRCDVLDLLRQHLAAGALAVIANPDALELPDVAHHLSMDD